TSTMDTARTYAKTFSGYNGAGEQTSLSLLDADIQFGYTDSSGSYTAQWAYNSSTGSYTSLSSSNSNFPNTVKVTLRRDASANSSSGLSAARPPGTSRVDLPATAAATLMAGTIDSFSSSSFTTRILPVAYDVNHWTTFILTGKDPDGGNSSYKGNPALAVYP